MAESRPKIKKKSSTRPSSFSLSRWHIILLFIITLLITYQIWKYHHDHRIIHDPHDPLSILPHSIHENIQSWYHQHYPIHIPKDVSLPQQRYHVLTHVNTTMTQLIDMLITLSQQGDLDRSDDLFYTSFTGFMGHAICYEMSNVMLVIHDDRITRDKMMDNIITAIQSTKLITIPAVHVNWLHVSLWHCHSALGRQLKSRLAAHYASIAASQRASEVPRPQPQPGDDLTDRFTRKRPTLQLDASLLISLYDANNRPPAILHLRPTRDIIAALWSAWWTSHDPLYADRIIDIALSDVATIYHAQQQALTTEIKEDDEMKLDMNDVSTHEMCVATLITQLQRPDRDLAKRVIERIHTKRAAGVPDNNITMQLIPLAQPYVDVDVKEAEL